MGQIRLFILLIGCVLNFGALPARAQDLGSLDGTWEGSLAAVTVPGAAGPPRLYTVHIVIAGTIAHVFAHDTTGGPFQELKPGAFHVSRLGPNGVIVAIDSGQDDEGTWVETWNFAVTLKRHDTLIVNLYRIVNNVNLPLNVDHSKFTEAEAGELARTK